MKSGYFTSLCSRSVHGRTASLGERVGLASFDGTQRYVNCGTLSALGFSPPHCAHNFRDLDTAEGTDPFERTLNNYGSISSIRDSERT